MYGIGILKSPTSLFVSSKLRRAKVESERIELSSKQVTKALSTCVVFYCFFDVKLAKDNLLNTYLLNLERVTKHYPILVNFYDALNKNATNQGFLRTFSLPTL